MQKDDHSHLIAPACPDPMPEIPPSVVLRRPVCCYGVSISATPAAAEQARVADCRASLGRISGLVSVVRIFEDGFALVRQQGNRALFIVAAAALCHAVAPTCDQCPERACVVVRRTNAGRPWPGPPLELCTACAAVEGYVVGVILPSGKISPLGQLPPKKRIRGSAP